MYTRLVSSWLFPLHEKLKAHDSVARRKALEESEWLPTEEILRRQLERLRTFLSEIGRQVPYYRELFKVCKFEPARLQSLADLEQLPLLDKATIRKHTEALKNEGADKLIRYNTGGSSGEPLVFFMGPDRVSHDVAAKWRATRWWDVDIGDRELVVWGSPVELGAQDRVRMLRDRLIRSELLPAFNMGDPDLDRFIDKIRRFRPTMLFGYPSAFARIAGRAQSKGIALDDLGIRVAFVTSERLYPEQKQLVEKVFGAPVANGYGGRDAGFIAHECPQGGLHISAEDIVVELVDAKGHQVAPGETGEVVVTHMATGDFPFVRYRTGDIASLSTEACPCGRGLPCLATIEGRTTDFITALDGTVMHGLALIYVVRDLPGVAGFKIIQESLERIRVQLVMDEATLPQDCREDLIRGFRQRLGEPVRVEIELVDRIAPEQSGKFRYVVSKVEATAG